MQQKQKGLVLIQAVLALALIAALAAYAVPAYENFVIRSKMAEAFTLASDTKNKLTEFYTATNRFPKKASERETIKTEAYTPPEFVHAVAVNYDNEINDVVIEVYFKAGSIPGAIFERDFLYLAGNTNSTGSIQWTCSAQGIDNRFLPDYCQS
jgi:type IV pilus assembly protein PilA